MWAFCLENLYNYHLILTTMTKYSETDIRSILLISDGSPDFNFFDEALSVTFPQVDFLYCKIDTVLNTRLSIHPDVVFLRMDQGARKGLECLEAMRKDFSPAELPIFVFGDSDLESDREAAYEKEANQFTPMPQDSKTLADTLQTILTKEVTHLRKTG